MSELYNTFHSHFDVVSADTVGLMETAFRMRYQVYCLERSYEDAESFPDQMEIDEFDMHSAHSLVRCQRSGQYAGLVRLVLPNPVDMDKPLPLEKFCHSAMQKAGIDLSSIPRDRMAEISRFSISKELKRQCAQKSAVSATGDVVDGVDTRMTPQIVLGLFAGVVRMSAQNNITHWLAVMEPTLLRFLSRYGIYFQKIGPVIDYHGRRQPTVASIDSVLSGIYAHRKDVWEVITDFGNVWPLDKEVKHFAMP
ncbi:MAG: PEP-CTERM/exosortase system-associated acyltransferase [Gammaproteobacteria bacterium]|nr:PEP-CTERM/exosortase system-associated acyltransferase [Gammaproteobacteria bacterium]